MKITSKNIEKLYPTETNDRILTYMQIVVEALESQYDGDIPQRLILQLDLLRDLWKNYFKVNQELAKSSIFLKGDGGRVYQNPALQTSQQLYQKIMDALKSLGVTVLEEKKMKLIDKKIGNDNEESAEKLLENLLN